jgi:hypothetical protein
MGATMRASAEPHRAPTRAALLFATFLAAASAGRAAATAAPGVGLPPYQEPPSYSETLVIRSNGSQVEMRRFVDHGSIRTEMSSAAGDVVMIELGDEHGTSYTLMPAEKMAIKQLRPRDASPAAVSPERAGGGAPAPVPAGVRLEDLGTDRVGDVAAKKLRITAPDGVMLAWFDAASGAPLRMETKMGGEEGTLAWKDRKVGPQPPSLFHVPEGYQLIDMAEMPSAAGMIANSGLRMAADQANEAFRGLGSNLGEGVGGSLGMALGGPLGGLVGRYVGGRVGGMLADQVSSKITSKISEPSRP